MIYLLQFLVALLLIGGIGFVILCGVIMVADCLYLKNELRAWIRGKFIKDEVKKDEH